MKNEKRFLFYRMFVNDTISAAFDVSFTFLMFFHDIHFVTFHFSFSPYRSTLSLFGFTIFIRLFHFSRTHSQTLRNTNIHTLSESETERYSLSVSCCVERVKIASV